ncbi:MAG TPA: ligase-associated DNA damage response endonuclease PdeM, partial [Gemmatimonadaceae bacterium]|nr:ligase-associated DNA damage response endonuclease PdeM [Gemmatimonadaceae bacterium]
MIAATVAGETLKLLADRAIYWPRRSTLLLADPHFGKAAAFRSAGVPVPRGTTTEALRRLDVLLDTVAASRIVFLGDFLHAREGRSPETFRVINAWRSRRAGLEMTLVRGNHDARAGDPPLDLDMRCVNEPLVETPFALAHKPAPHADGYVLAGHLHPAARLRGAGRQST